MSSAKPRRRRQEAETRLRKITTLTEQLSLASYRDELNQELSDRLERRRSSYEESCRELDKAEKREKAFQNALREISRLTDGQPLIRELVEKELEELQTRCRGSCANGGAISE